MDICRAMDISAALFGFSGVSRADGKSGRVDGRRLVAEDNGGGGLEAVGLGLMVCAGFMLVLLSAGGIGGAEKGMSEKGIEGALIALIRRLVG